LIIQKITQVYLTQKLTFTQKQTHYTKLK